MGSEMCIRDSCHPESSSLHPPSDVCHPESSSLHPPSDVCHPESSCAGKLLFGGGCIAYTTSALDKSQILGILLNADDSLITREPPVKPKAGKTYVIECSTYEDWACDQYPWQFIGKSNAVKDGTVLFKNYYHLRLPGSKQGKGRSRPNTSNKFTRAAYYSTA